MIRKAFKMKVYSEQVAEYIRRHNPIWPELETALKEHGTNNYSIFIDPQSNCLFAYVETVSENQWNAIAQTEICQKWWKYMADLMETNPDDSPVSLELTEVFHLA
ncbi:L-rhamnose mutarotase [Pseudozobellia thermophila]|uniref:L-rhamnose mutarotase n=1 Tax=Pseudozobellia thermophila TaxID=192903 RepID=A0A1M6HKX2_9FLAO|nr:L-rhamnose mutarotase [Pseudozobellia thermophila]SHJ22864.1 L-rhamnose mutarotase [Pseudozobellia thermophila]